MGTRADFYVGVGGSAEWIGSVAWDGHEWAEAPELLIPSAKTEGEFREAVALALTERDDATTPDMGWPWPWDTSSTTDYAYYFAHGVVRWDERDDWPDMSEIKNVTLGDRSGVIVVGTPEPPDA